MAPFSKLCQNFALVGAWLKKLIASTLFQCLTLHKGLKGLRLEFKVELLTALAENRFQGLILQ